MASLPSPEASLDLLTLFGLRDADLRQETEPRVQALLTDGASLPMRADEADRPFTAAEFARLSSSKERSMEIVLPFFHHAGREFGFAVTLDNRDCGAIVPITPLPPGLSGAERQSLIDRMVPDIPYTIDVEHLSGSEAWTLLPGAAHTALAHCEDGDSLGLDAMPDIAEEVDDLDEMDAIELVSRPAWCSILTAYFHEAGLSGPVPDHGEHVESGRLPSFEDEFLPLIGAPPRPVLPEPDRSGPTPVYRLRIDIKGAKPPIWRRLEVMADASLADLHSLIRTVFDWHGHHLYDFETPCGRFADPDEDLGFTGDDADVSLDQVLAATGDKITYTYDFGDDWEHVVKLEKIDDPSGGTQYPRCTKVHLAAPREDSGGVHSEHERGVERSIA
ncbi:plasmid pRiA4b ORF-3 family protein [Salininema proteolyticum]|uniref:Plasmid pRiA4b ORF-3 family protein n=1 Tax=Salininema proteolyticum TaxID=1607685 RepID=A0ABV8U3F1_9ACTN